METVCNIFLTAICIFRFNSYTIMIAAILIDGNSLNGTADVICEDDFFDLQFFSSDCLGPNAELSCDCCSLCCNDNSNVTCNNFEWTLNLDPIWEYAHSRAFFTVDLSELDDENP